MTRGSLAKAAAGAALVIAVAACSTADRAAPTTTSTRRSTTSSTTVPPSSSACGASRAVPQHYESVVVFSFENRRWNDVGLGFGSEMPYLQTLGAQCSWFPVWTETDVTQNSLTQYVGQITGSRQPGTKDDCSPSSTCSTDADSLFRQLRTSGRSAINYVEGATRSCSADGNAVRHVPAMYLWRADDRRHCNEQVRPLRELNVEALPDFAFITPTECHDGHDCGNDTVDRWARDHIQPVLDSRAYRAGKVAVFVWYDEDEPVPNLWITPTARPGRQEADGAGAAATLRAWQEMLGLPCLADACSAPDMRTPAGS